MAASYAPEWPTDDQGNLVIVTDSGRRRHYSLCSRVVSSCGRSYTLIIPRDRVDNQPIVCAYRLTIRADNHEVHAAVTPLTNSWERLHALQLLTRLPTHAYEVH